MRIVVTGASGFLGRALLRKLALNNVDVVGVSRHHVSGLVQVKNYMEAPEGDVLVHLAEASDRKWVEGNASTYEQSALETLGVLLEKGFERVVYASSAVLYGDQSVLPHSVEDPVHVVDAYTRLKHLSEQAVLSKNGTVARLANLYGHGMSDKNVLSAILEQIPLGGPIKVLDATPIRDFLWFEDAAEALAIMSLGNVSGIFNVGTGQGVSILELVQIVLKAAGQAGRTVESGYLGLGRSNLVIDISATVSEFGWHPNTSLQKGIETLIKMTKE